MANLIDIDKLVTVRTFANQYVRKGGKVGCSAPWIYQLQERGEVEIITIDGVNFVKLEP